MTRFPIPNDAVAIRLVRPYADDLREYEAMEAPSGRRAIDLLFRQQLVHPGEYGMADFLNKDGNIVGEYEMDRLSFRCLLRKLRCRVVREVYPAPPEEK